jgi:spore maturation protein CgeB
MKILCVFGEHNYGDPQRGVGYEYTNFIPAFRRLGHEIVFFESWNKGRYTGFADLNRQFLTTVEQTQPDLIVCVLLGCEVWVETLAMVREVSDAAIINWATDDSWKYDQFSRFILPSFDLYATTYWQAKIKASREGYHHVHLTQWAANAENLRTPIPSTDCRWDVSFVGTAYGNRTQWIASLKARGIRVECFGHGWENGPVAAETIPEIIRQSKISLNFGDSNWMLKGFIPYKSRQIKARVFEVPGCGGFLMTEYAQDMENYFKLEKELVLFHSLDVLEEKIRYFLANPARRDQIAMAGHLRTRHSHTYDRRFEILLNAVGNMKINRLKKSDRPAEKQNINDEKFDRLERAHQPTTYLNLLRQALVIPCNLVWGRYRGPRAARRILFELSWRLCGKKTYSASGWPGRLFYHES